MDYVIAIDNLLSSLLIVSFVPCYNSDNSILFHRHYRQLVMDASDNKNEIPKINHLPFHLIHQNTSCEELLLVRLHY